MKDDKTSKQPLAVKGDETETVRFTVIIPREAYEHMKAKAQAADISMNKFLCRAGSVVTTEQVAVPPGFNSGGAVSYEEYLKNNDNNN